MTQRSRIQTPYYIANYTQTSSLNFKAICKVVPKQSLQPDSSVYTSVPNSKMAKLWAGLLPPPGPFSASEP